MPGRDSSSPAEWFGLPFMEVFGSNDYITVFGRTESVTLRAFVDWLHKSEHPAAVQILTRATEKFNKRTNKVFPTIASADEPATFRELMTSQMSQIFHVTRAMHMYCEESAVVRRFYDAFFTNGPLRLGSLLGSRYLASKSTCRVRWRSTDTHVTSIPLALELPFYFHALRVFYTHIRDLHIGELALSLKASRVGFATQLVVHAWMQLRFVDGARLEDWIFEHVTQDDSDVCFVPRDAAPDSDAESKPVERTDRRFWADQMLAHIKKLVLDKSLFNPDASAEWAPSAEYRFAENELPPVIKSLQIQRAGSGDPDNEQNYVQEVDAPAQRSSSPGDAATDSRDRLSADDAGISAEGSSPVPRLGADDIADALATAAALTADPSSRRPEPPKHVSPPTKRLRVAPSPSTSGYQTPAQLALPPSGFTRWSALPLSVVTALSSASRSTRIFLNLRDASVSHWGGVAQSVLRDADKQTLLLVDGAAAGMLLYDERVEGARGACTSRVLATRHVAKRAQICALYGTLLYQALETLPTSWVDAESGVVFRRKHAAERAVPLGLCQSAGTTSVPVFLVPAPMCCGGQVRKVQTGQNNAEVFVSSGEVAADAVHRSGHVVLRAKQDIAPGEEITIAKNLFG